MRLLITIVVSIALTSGAALAETDTQRYNGANKLFTDGNYLAALEMYNSIGIENQNLEYNRAVTYFKLGRLGKAVLHFNRALRLNPQDEDTKANLRYINSVKKDREKGYIVGKDRQGKIQKIPLLAMIQRFRRLCPVSMRSPFFLMVTSTCHYLHR